MVKFTAALALVALSACAQPNVDAAPVWVDGDTEPRVTFVPADDELAALLTAADLAWEAAGVHPDFIMVAAPGAAGNLQGTPVEWRTTADVSAECGMAPGLTAIGCMLPNVLLVSSDAAGSKLNLIVRHEMGHAMRDLTEQWHIECDDRTTATMCDRSTAPAISAADTDFICASASLPCN